MSKKIEMLIYEIALRVRLFMASKAVGKTVADLTERESLLLELIGMREDMNISEIAKLCPMVSNSTISMTITRLWKDKKLVEKRILPENQRITIVRLTKEGRDVLNEIKKTQSVAYKAVAESLGLSPEQDEYFKLFIQNGIVYFDKKLGLHINMQAV
jgi:DNA-binding MarR family transcriptional regulator